MAQSICEKVQHFVNALLGIMIYFTFVALALI